MAVVTLIDDTQAWFKGRHGTVLTSVPRASTWASAVLASSEPVVILDTTLDPRSCDSPLVTQAPFIRFHVGLPLTTPDGLVVGALCVFDVHPRPVPAPSRLAALRELAALAVDELELRRARDEDKNLFQMSPAVDRPTAAQRSLYAAYVAKSEFLSSLSHELRTPLNAITGYAGLIAGADDTPAIAANHAGEIMSAARHMLALVNDILEYSRLEAGQVTIGWQYVQLRAPLEEARRMVAVFAASRGVILERDHICPNAAIRGDPVRLKQVLLNLLTNAIKFTPRGGRVTMGVTATEDGQVEITIQDTGIGIDAADIPKALTPFGQIVPGNTGPLEGTGLGLPIAKALVERLGGTLSLVSDVGVGTRVSVRMPAFQVPWHHMAESTPPTH